MLRILIVNFFIFYFCSVFANPEMPSGKEIEGQKSIIKNVIDKSETPEINKEVGSILNKSKFGVSKITRENSKVEIYNVEEYYTKKDSNNMLDKTLKATNEIQKINGKMTNTAKPYVLVSFSMPNEEIESLVLEAKKIGGIVSFRGFYHDSLEETIKKIKEIAKQNIGGLTIDPTLFVRFDVESVPTFILPVNNFPVCTKSGCDAPDYIKATGSSSFRYFLNLVVSDGDHKYSDKAKEYLSKY